MSQADRDRAYELVGKWFADHADKIRGGNKLRPAYTATTVRLDAGDEPVVTDGPIVEAKGSSAATPRSTSPISTRQFAWSAPGLAARSWSYARSNHDWR